SFFFFSSRRRHTRSKRDWSSDVCSSDLTRRTFERIAADYSREQKEGKAKKRCAYEEAVHTYYEMEGGVPEAQAYENFGERCAARSEERRVGREGRGRDARGQPQQRRGRS